MGLADTNALCLNASWSASRVY